MGLAERQVQVAGFCSLCLVAGQPSLQPQKQVTSRSQMSATLITTARHLDRLLVATKLRVNPMHGAVAAMLLTAVVDNLDGTRPARR